MKIAFCFLTYDNIIRSDIWNTFFENIDKDKYLVFIHPKNIINNNYTFNYNYIKNIINTTSKYDISIVKATLNLLEESYKLDKSITHFVFLSQSCIPLYNFNKLYNLIKELKNSVISYIDNNKKDRYYKLSNTIKKHINYNNFVKQQPNMILIREDVSYLVNNNLIDHFKFIECPDEHYFINVLLYIFKKKIFKHSTHFCNTDLNKTQALEFNNINNNFINKIRELGFIFMRKLNKNSIIDIQYIFE